MKKGRTIAIGDIHGEITKLNNLTEKLNLQNNDKLVFLGDYIDRGFSSKEVIDKLTELSKSFECVFLMGNHEDMLLKTKSRDERDVGFWLYNGGMTTLDSYGDYFNIFKLHKDFFDNLKLYYQTEDYFFVHAGIQPDKPADEQKKEYLLWIRDDFIYKKHKLKQKVIFGHTPFENPYIDDDKIGIDTGCGKDKTSKLTAFICYEETFIQSD